MYRFSFNDISIIPFISGKYQRRKYSAWGGYVQIPSGGQNKTENDETQNIVGNVISYEQQVMFLALKLNVEYNISRTMSVLGILKYSPYIYANCIDTHHVRNKQFIDKMNGGFCVGTELEFRYKAIGIIISYEYLKSSSNAKTHIGDVGITESSNALVSGYVPGIKSSIWFVGCMYKFN
ncbi:MAG: omptin family outer membrane protease [Treponema sp.]|nr:omptin family outer membrane protease [Treponema sp.]